MNASTYNYMTIYPVASLSEEQLLRYADFYTDSCFNPLVIENEDLFRQEAWRYRMDTVDDPLTIEGTVYSEMKGAYNLDSAAYYNALKTIYPGSTCGNVHGGIPEEIPGMTWDDLKAYHEKYYHPSNSLTLIYGDISDMGAFLDLLDGYFSAYERREFDIGDSLYTPITESVTAEFPFPGDAGADPSKQAQTYYAIFCDGATEEDVVTLDLLTTLMSVDSSVVMKTIREKLPAASAGCYVDDTTDDVTVIFYAGSCGRLGSEFHCSGIFGTLDGILHQLSRKSAEGGYGKRIADIAFFLQKSKFSLMRILLRDNHDHAFFGSFCRTGLFDGIFTFSASGLAQNKLQRHRVSPPRIKTCLSLCFV